MYRWSPSWSSAQFRSAMDYFTHQCPSHAIICSYSLSSTRAESCPRCIGGPKLSYVMLEVLEVCCELLRGGDEGCWCLRHCCCC